MPMTFSVPSFVHLRRVAADIAEQYELDLVVLFGSAARGAVQAPHDLDIGVVAGNAARPLVDALAMTNTFIERLHIQPIDLVDLRRADPVLLLQAARDGIALFERTPSRFAEFVSLAARRFADTKKFRDAEATYIEDFLASRRNGQ